MAAATDGVSRPSHQHHQQADDEEDDSDDQDDVSEREGRDEAGKDEPEDDEDDSENDHDVYLVLMSYAVDAWEVGRHAVRLRCNQRPFQCRMSLVCWWEERG